MFAVIVAVAFCRCRLCADDCCRPQPYLPHYNFIGYSKRRETERKRGTERKETAAAATFIIAVNCVTSFWYSLSRFGIQFEIEYICDDDDDEERTKNQTFCFASSTVLELYYIFCVFSCFISLLHTLFLSTFDVFAVRILSFNVN